MKAAAAKLEDFRPANYWKIPAERYPKSKK